MIYAVSLAVFVKKAFKEKGRQTNVKTLSENMILDPAITAMDLAVIAPKDLGGIFDRKTLIRALTKKHENVKVIYLYQKDSEKLELKNITQIQCKKVTDEFIVKAVNDVLMNSVIQTKDIVIISKDSIAALPENRESDQLSTSKESYEVKKTQLLIEEDSQELNIIEVVDEIENKDVDLEEGNKKQLEEKIQEATCFTDWDALKNALKKDALVKELLDESSKYEGTVLTLEILEKRIWSIFSDTSIPFEEKFARVKKVGLEKSNIKAMQNDLISQKTISIINSVVQSASDIVNRKIDDIRKGYEQVAKKDIIFRDQEVVRGLMDQRLQTQVELILLSKDVIETYSLMDKSITSVISNLDENLPSENGFINEAMSPISNIFTPSNTPIIVNKLISSLQSNLIPMSALEDKIKTTIQLVFKLCEDDQKTIEHMQRITDMMQVQRLEEIVIIKDIIQNSMRLYIGENETGRTATVLTYSGVLSRRNNVLVIDLTGNSKINQYGMETVLLHDFLNSRIEKKLCCVAGTIDNIADLDDIIKELKNRLSYYPYIQIILDPSQTELITELAKYSISCNFISDCRPGNMVKIRGAVEVVKPFQNIARKVILIDPPIESYKILENLNVDLITAKLIILPNIKYIKACSLTNSRPWESEEVFTMFEMAFK